MDDYHVRLAVEQDLDAIIALWKEFMKHQTGIEPRFKVRADGEQYFRTWAADALKSPRRTLFVAQSPSGELVGYTLLNVVGSVPYYEPQEFGYVQDAFVLEPFRGKGIGWKLTQAALAWFKEQGLAYAMLHVLDKNERGVAFWRQVGFDGYVHNPRLELI